MQRISRILWSLIALIGGIQGVVAAGPIPFTDVKLGAPYYSAVETLYRNGVIADDGTHLFQPEALMTRDFYVSLAVGIDCKKCEIPSPSDIIRYQTSPFVDLSKSNPYYYCIAYAREKNIAQGYITDQYGQVKCENGTSYTTSPFCAANTITRIEAASILLRRAELWNDSLNSPQSPRTLSIPDASDYWYGYAKKAIDIGLITQKADGTIGQDEKITRGEFAIMAAKILSYIQCRGLNDRYSVEAMIGIYDQSGAQIQKTLFTQGENFSLKPIIPEGTWNYSWTATNMSGQVVTASGDVMPGSLLSVGTWSVVLDVRDATGNVVSSPNLTITIVPNSNTKSTFPCVSLSATPISGDKKNSFLFTPSLCDTGNPIDLTWDYGDGTRSTSSGVTTHKYRTPGVYPVTVIARDTITGNTSQSVVIIRVTGDTDSDGDGISDKDDLCPQVVGVAPTGCPDLPYYDISKATNGGGSSASTDTDGDGIPDSRDLCPRVKGIEPYGCPTIENPWTLGDNRCLISKQSTQGLIIGSMNCTQCPCDKSITINSLLRPCDIVFPTILSPNQDAVYARGGFFTVQ